MSWLGDKCLENEIQVHVTNKSFVKSIYILSFSFLTNNRLHEVPLNGHIVNKQCDMNVTLSPTLPCTVTCCVSRADTAVVMETIHTCAAILTGGGCAVVIIHLTLGTWKLHFHGHILHSLFSSCFLISAENFWLFSIITFDIGNIDGYFTRVKPQGWNSAHTTHIRQKFIWAYIWPHCDLHQPSLKIQFSLTVDVSSTNNCDSLKFKLFPRNKCFIPNLPFSAF